jgi:plastocyanin
MRRCATLAALAGALALAPAAFAQHGGHGAAAPPPGGPRVSMLATTYAPAHLDVLAGDAVTWSNDSVRRHTVTATGGSWTSPDVWGGATFTRALDAPGVVPYYCKVHPSMRGEVGVHRLLLDAPGEATAPGRAFALEGRAALAAGTPVTIEADDGERSGDEGRGFRRVADATVGDGGAFRVSVAPRATTRYRALAGAEASPEVQLVVLDRAIAAHAHRDGARSTVRVDVTPASPRATVVLQLRLPERFGWWPVRARRLDGRSSAVFRLTLHRRLRARVVLTLADRATVLAVSDVMRIGTRSRPRR